MRPHRAAKIRAQGDTCLICAAGKKERDMTREYEDKDEERRGGPSTRLAPIEELHSASSFHDSSSNRVP